MGVDSKHPQYLERVEEWQRCRDACSGEDAVKAAGDLYLPRLGGQDSAKYEAYKKRAMYYEAVGRTVDGFTGAISRKPPKVEVPASINALVDDASSDGVSLSELMKRLCKETILLARSGLLVDFDDKSKFRPYITLYTAESITNWWKDCVICHETVYEADQNDRFKQVPIEQYRELSLVDGVYTVTVWRKKLSENGANIEWAVHTQAQPTARGRTLDQIPFFWLTPLGKTNTIERPPLLGMVNISMSHYRSSADLEHGRHFSGLPTLYVISDTIKEGETFEVGSTSAIVVRDSNAKVGYAEVEGNFASLEHALDHKEMQMAALGAAVFQAAQRKGVEAAETARIRISGENSLLMGTVEAIEESLGAALKCAARWAGSSDSGVKVTLNKDFISSYMEPQTLQGLVAAYQSGAYGLDSFLYALQQADLIPPDADLTIEKEKVIAEATKRAAAETALAVQVKSAAGNTAAV